MLFTIHHTSKTGFLNLGSKTFWALAILGWRGLPCALGDSNIIQGLYPLDASSLPLIPQPGVTTKNVS